MYFFKGTDWVIECKYGSRGIGILFKCSEKLLYESHDRTASILNIFPIKDILSFESRNFGAMDICILFAHFLGFRLVLSLRKDTCVYL